MTDLLSPSAIIPVSLIEQDIAEATTLRDRWARHLANLKQTGCGRLRINGQWESSDEAATRIQQVIDHHAGTIGLLEAFRAEWSNGG